VKHLPSLDGGSSLVEWGVELVGECISHVYVAGVGDFDEATLAPLSNFMMAGGVHPVSSDVSKFERPINHTRAVPQCLVPSDGSQHTVGCTTRSCLRIILKIY
jgi:hypothetical protein